MILTPRLISDAAAYLDAFGAADSSEFCPAGIGSADAGQHLLMVVAAVAQGFDGGQS